MENMLFDGWQPLLRTVIVGVLAYASLVLFLRISGKRTLTKLNAFDLVVTVSLGSTLASVLISKDVALAQGALALALLVALQYVITFSSVRISWLRHVITGEPTLLLYQGACLYDAMRRERVKEEEIRSAIRSSGIESLNDVQAVVLETDGSMSVVPKSEGANRSSLEGVQGVPSGSSDS